jgi:hypothetical protein
MFFSCSLVAAIAPINARELTMIESGSMPSVSASYFLYYFAHEKVEVNLDHNEQEGKRPSQRHDSA